MSTFSQPTVEPPASFVKIGMKVKTNRYARMVLVATALTAALVVSACDTIEPIEEEASALRTNPRAFGLLVEGGYFLLSSCSDLKADRNILVVSFRLP